MSVFLSITAPEGAYLLTDAATYDDNGVVRKIDSKVWRSWRAPVAITTRGHAEAGEAIAVTLTNLADEIGADAFLAALPGLVADMADGMAALAGSNAVQVQIAAFACGRGQHRAFATDMMQQNFDKPAFEVYEPPVIFATGPFIDAAGLRSAGVDTMRPSETMGAYVERVGADILEVMRRIPAPTPAGVVMFGIGGRVELTTVDELGARTEVLRTWPDEIGQRVQPFMTRADRRRAMRAAG